MADSGTEDSSLKRRGSGNIRNAEKKARREGQGFVTSTGKLIEQKKTGPDCKCRKLCTDDFSVEHKFGRPQVDVCSQCEDLNTKMRSSLNDNAKLAAAAEMLVHKRRANKFYKKNTEHFSSM
ncbi:hypothetical protein J6590_068592 [Homalodisca vitripennis]|nr:hypothetical protein J6590_068592 [Homalodisca vitripennis]